jgi:predicted enzyme related to lactoylglutathione lyase
MRVTGITANLPVADIATASEFYREYLGLSVEAMNLGWVARYASADGRTSVQLVTGDASAPQDSVISVHVGSDVDEAYAEACRRGYRSCIRSPMNLGACGDSSSGPRWQHHQRRQSFRRVGRPRPSTLQRRRLRALRLIRGGRNEMRASIAVSLPQT